MSRLASLLFTATTITMISGCSIMAPNYSASIENVQKLKEAGNYVAKVGTFESSKAQDNPNPISIRGNSLSSPYQDSYAAYLTEALKAELSLAGKLDQNAEVEISGVLVKNDIDASGFSKGHGVIEARFVIKKKDKILYDQVKSIRNEWESSFAGAIAIPKAQQEYPHSVQKLLEALYSDSKFFEALK